MQSAPGETRSGTGLMNGIGQLGGLAQDMGQQFGKKGGFKPFKRGWAQIGIYLAIANLLYGLGVVAWSFIAMRNHLSGGFACMLGALRSWLYSHMYSGSRSHSMLLLAKSQASDGAHGEKAGAALLHSLALRCDAGAHQAAPCARLSAEQQPASAS